MPSGFQQPAPATCSVKPSANHALNDVAIAVVGAGVAGLTVATELSAAGALVTVYERSAEIGASACSWLAGGMLAPFCEREATEPLVSQRGRDAVAWWQQHVPQAVQRGSIVLAAGRDRADLLRFAKRTTGHRSADAAELAELEPDLSGRFNGGLFFPEEGHLDPRLALPALASSLADRGVKFEMGRAVEACSLPERLVVDCRGLSARDELPQLRGVRGEMLLIRSRDIQLSRPVRLLHPRFPLYIVPRDNDQLMLGATSIESEHPGPTTVRSAMELLNAAYALHPALAEAEIIELAAGVRPAFPDNLPGVTAKGRVIYFNGLYRHGFLLSPWYAKQCVEKLTEIWSERT